MRASSLVQLSGRNSRKPRMIGTSLDASVTDTSVWQFAFLPSADAYCGATPTDAVPFYGKAVSSMISHALSPPTSASALFPKCRLQRCAASKTRANEVMQPIIVNFARPRRHRLDILAISRPDQTRNIGRAHPLPSLVTKSLQIRLQPTLQINPPITIHRRLPANVGSL